MRPSTTALALGSAAALALSGVSAAEPPHGGEPAHKGQAPASESRPASAPSSSATRPGESKAPATAEPKDATAEPSPYEGLASPEKAPGDEPSPATPAPAVTLRPQLRTQREPAPVEKPPEPIAPARDTLGGHFVIGAGAGLLVPFGSIASGVPQSRTMGLGLAIGGDVAYGISRTVMLGAYVDVGWPAAEGASSANTISTLAVGPLIRYHLVQGLPFDPWLSGGFGYRRTADGPTSFTGVDWVRLAIGGDWYPASNLGFGPVLEMSIGTFFGQSPGSIGTTSVNAHFVLGGRVVFDAPGK